MNPNKRDESLELECHMHADILHNYNHYLCG